jgi:hypothetical protein
MKKFIIALTVSVFALAGSLHADDKAPTTKVVADKAACCDKAKGSCCQSACSKTPSKSVLMSPKAAEQAK